MGAVFKSIASYIAVAVEAGAALLILIGALEAFYKMLQGVLGRQLITGTRRAIRVEFGVWLLLRLEFELAADIIRTAISPSWNDIGQLAAIASIRTALNYFLEMDIEKSGDSRARVESPG
jgi:uncharacterized membrane protein